MKKGLACLVGTNPLPVCVSAIYFIKNCDIRFVRLICTGKTRALANNVVRLLKERFAEFKTLDISIKEIPSKSDVDEIRNNVRKLSEQFKASGIESVYLDYTGGTKAMCVHTAIQMREIFADKCVLVYQDSESFCLLSRDENLGSGAGNLLEVVSLSLDDIIELHGLRKKTDFNSSEEFNPILARQHCGELIADIMSFYKEGRLSDVYNAFNPLVSCLSKNYDNFNEILTEWGKGKEIIFNVENGNDSSKKGKEIVFDNQCLINFIQKISPEANPFSLSPLGFKLCTDDTDKKLWLNTVKFFCGFWLEIFCADICEGLLQDMKDKDESSDNADGFLIDRYELISNLRFIPESGQENFEIDVLFRNGYMLTGISCSAAGKRECKLKGFEVIQRVRQLGGDESGAILFTCLGKQDIKKLKDDLAYESQRENKILVLGINDMKSGFLEKKILNFITEAGGGR